MLKEDLNSQHLCKCHQGINKGAWKKACKHMKPNWRGGKVDKMKNKEREGIKETYMLIHACTHAHTGHPQMDFFNFSCAVKNNLKLVYKHRNAYERKP